MGTGGDLIDLCEKVSLPAVLSSHWRVLADELNVKEVTPVYRIDDCISFNLRPNAKVLGKRLGREMPSFAETLSAMTPKRRSRAVASLQHTGIAIIGRRRFRQGELLTDFADLYGTSAAAERDLYVIVSTELTPELVQEGLAREIVHRIQNLRKDAGFEIADRIKTYYAGDTTVRDVMKRFDAYVRQETLTVALSDDAPEHGVHSETANIDGHEITLSVVRV
jgi:isoleucyl-tRNA synthetase